ncbi:MAG: TadE family protein [Ilumatobacteraceae bacterium]
MKTENGSATVELVLLTPVLMILMLFVVIAGRSGESQIEVHHAADQAARAASMVHPRSMQAVAERVAREDLSKNGVGCTNSIVELSITESELSRSVTVFLDCVVNRDGLDLLGLGERHVSADSTEIIDRWRVD